MSFFHASEQMLCQASVYHFIKKRLIPIVYEKTPCKKKPGLIAWGN